MCAEDGCGAVGIKGRRITKMGLFQTNEGMKVSGLLLLAATMAAIALYSLQFFIFTWVAEAAALIAVVILVTMMLMVTATNILMAKKIVPEEFENGKITEVIITDTKDDRVKYLAFVDDGNSDGLEGEKP
jgi:hypothetical protein